MRSARIFEPFAARQRRASVGNIGAGRAAFLDQPGRLQLAIGAGDRVGIDGQLFGQVRMGGSSSPGGNRPAATRYFT